MTTTAPRKRAARKAAAPKPAVVDEVRPEVEVEAVVEPVAEVVEHDEVDVEAADDAPELDVAEQKAKYVAKRKLTFRGQEYQPGDPVPGAEEINRIETWVVHGYLKEA